MEWWQKAGIGLKWHLPGCRVGLVNLESCEGVRLQISPRLTRGQSSNTWRGDHEMDTRPERPFGVTTIITEPSLTVRSPITELFCWPLTPQLHVSAYYYSYLHKIWPVVVISVLVRFLYVYLCAHNVQSLSTLGCLYRSKVVLKINASLLIFIIVSFFPFAKWQIYKQFWVKKER